MAAPKEDEVAVMRAVLYDRTRPLAERYRALFSLRNAEGESLSPAVRALTELLEVRGGKDGSLLRHELAFALGQMQSAEAIDTLEFVLRDGSESAIVRHEAAEALGAIGVERERCCALLEEFSRDAAAEVRETCELALERFRAEAGGRDENFGSVDPAVPLDEETDEELVAAAAGGDVVAALQRIMLDGSVPIARRYGALFALRNRFSVGPICRALLEASSALLRHEIAYFLDSSRTSSQSARYRSASRTRASTRWCGTRPRRLLERSGAMTASSSSRTSRATTSPSSRRAVKLLWTCCPGRTASSISRWTREEL